MGFCISEHMCNVQFFVFFWRHSEWPLPKPAMSAARQLGLLYFLTYLFSTPCPVNCLVPSLSWILVLKSWNQGIMRKTLLTQNTLIVNSALVAAQCGPRLSLVSQIFNWPHHTKWAKGSLLPTNVTQKSNNNGKEPIYMKFHTTQTRTHTLQAISSLKEYFYKAWCSIFFSKFITNM